MMFQMSYSASCRDHEVQNRLCAALTDWAEGLNRRLAEQGKSLLFLNRFKSRRIDGHIEVSKALQSVFRPDQLDHDCLLSSLTLNGIQINIPQCFDASEELSLLFIQAEGAIYDGLAVHLKKSSSVPPSTAHSPVVASVIAGLRSQLADLYQASYQRKHAQPEWTISRPGFLPRLHGAWFSKLIAALQGFDSTLCVNAIDREFLSAPQNPAATASEYDDAMEALAAEYLESVAHGEVDEVHGSTRTTQSRQ